MSGSTDAILRAFCESVCPGLATDATAGAPDLAAERYVQHYLAPETIARIVEALDRGSSFVALDPEQRLERIDRARLDAGTRRDLDSAAAATMLAVYGSWSGRDADGTLVRTPLGWQLTGFAGPLASKLDELER